MGRKAEFQPAENISGRTMGTGSTDGDAHQGKSSFPWRGVQCYIFAMRRMILSLGAAFILLAMPLAAAEGDWPHWRGPNDDGMARGDAPLHWSDTEHIAWKAAIPGRGFSSPIIWGDRIFVTTAVPASASVPRGVLPEHRFVVMAFDRKTGKPLWEHVARVATPHESHHAQYGSFASNSPITDGSHVFAFFGSRGLYCYSLDGELVWQKDFGPLRMFMTFGEGAWTALDGNKLFVVLDHEDASFLVALDKGSGRELWRTPRQGNTNWSGPYVTTANGRRQLIVSASREVSSYDPETGQLLWKARGLGQNTIPAPVAADGLVFAMSGYRNPNLMAIRLDREGDLTDTDAIVWQNQRGNSYSASPVLYEGKLYVLTDSGMLSCFDAKTGRPLYQQVRLPKPYNFKSSPVGANGKLYLASEEGDVIVVKMGGGFEVLATNTLTDEQFIATPAIADGEIYLRGRNTLYAIR
jgi:outer membrane protein assembly factor BamB